MKIEKPLKLAIYRNIEPGSLNNWEHIGEAKTYDGIGTYVRVSDYVEAQFAPLKDDAVIQGALRALDAAELQVREELQRKLDQINDQRNQLKAITHKS